MRYVLTTFVVMLVLSGCRTEPCFESIAMNPVQGRAIVFNRCDGTYQMLGTSVLTTTTTTLPSF